MKRNKFWINGILCALLIAAFLLVGNKYSFHMNFRQTHDVYFLNLNFVTDKINGHSESNRIGYIIAVGSMRILMVNK